MFKLSPSDFNFLYEECRRCFYLKVARGIERPRTPMPKIFTRIDLLLKGSYSGKRTAEISPALPPGRVEFSEKWVQSQPVEFPGLGACFIRGKFDTAMGFDEGGFGIVDFKTSIPHDDHVRLYSRQLQAYSFALENAAPGKLRLAPVTVLGILCVEPRQMVALGEIQLYAAYPRWIPVPRDDDSFMQFLREVTELLSQPEPPPPTSKCPFCAYRNGSDKNLLVLSSPTGNGELLLSSPHRGGSLRKTRRLGA